MAEEQQNQLNIKMDDQTAKGVHASDVIVVTSEKDMCLSFYVLLGPGQGIVTSRVFLPHSTALQMAEIIKNQIGPAKQLFDDITKKLPPKGEHGTSGK